jgi:cell division septal protein FtsQ
MSVIMEANQRREWMKSRRKMRKAARGARTRRQIFRMLLLVGMLFGAGACFTHLPWNLKAADQVIVHGNAVASREQVLRQLASAMNVPIYRLDPKQLENQIGSLKAVRHAFVRRYALPRPHLVVEVLEEYPWATFSRDPKLPPEAVIAQSGRFIPIAEFPAVVQPKLVIYGQPTLKLTSHEVTQWARWVNYIGAQTGRPVDSVDMRQPFDVRVCDGDLNFKLGMPDGTLTRRLGRLVSILPAIEPLKDKLKIEYIDMGLDNSIPVKISKNAPKARERALQEALRNASGANATASAQTAGAPNAVANDTATANPNIASTAATATTASAVSAGGGPTGAGYHVIPGAVNSNLNGTVNPARSVAQSGHTL